MSEGGKARIARFFRSFLLEIFPDRYTCVFCGKELFNANRLGTCDSCRDTLPFVSVGASCIKCGKPFVPEGTDLPEPLVLDGQDVLDSDNPDLTLGYCSICRRAERHFDQARSVFAYMGAPRDAVHRLKYGNARYLAPYLSAYLADAYLSDPVPVDLVVAVPIHAKRRRQRGYNQADLLARHLAERLQLSYLSDGLTKVRATDIQTHLSFRARQDNLHSAFACFSPQVRGKNVLVVDDVLTTGATLSEAARALREAGAVHVYGLTVVNVPDTIG